MLEKLKLYRVAKVLKYMWDSWPNSAFVIKQSSQSNRLLVYFDILFWYIFYGHDFNDYCTFEFWNKSTSEKKNYVSLRRNDVLASKFSTREVRKAFLDKAAFNLKFRNYIHRAWLDTRCGDWQLIESFIIKHSPVIAKPLEDYGGHGIFKIDAKKSDYDSEILRLKNVIGGGKYYILEEIIENREDIKAIAPGSLNTIRFVTVVDRNKKLHILASLLRMGNGRALTDNYHDGGMACAIDVDKGALTGKAYGMNCVKYEIHPYSKIKFDGYKLDGYQSCVNIIKEIAMVEPLARYVGWDLAITPNGIELLEGNIPPGEDITQIATKKGIWFDMLNWE